MTANELAEILQGDELDESILYYYGDRKTSLVYQAGSMLRQQEQTIERYHNMLRYKDVEIADLKIANQDLKYQLIQKSGEQVLNDFFAKEILKKASEK
jgi:hypothetical protein